MASTTSNPASAPTATSNARSRGRSLSYSMPRATMKMNQAKPRANGTRPAEFMAMAIASVSNVVG